MKQTNLNTGVENPIGRSICRVRESIGMTREQLARSIGTTEEMISEYEGGTRSIEAEVFLNVVEALGVTPNDFATESMREKAPCLFGYAKLDSNHRKIIDSVVTSFLRDESKKTAT